MSAIKEVLIEIEEMLDEGYRPITISALLNVPLEWVYDVVESRHNNVETKLEI